ncbi:MAG TPA: hypothetical protein VGC80_07725 [Acetobacteraceae bacterium]
MSGGVSPLRVDPADPGFLDGVFADLIRIARTPSGQATLAAMRASPRTVTIRKPDPAPNPPNAWTEPDGAEVAIFYHPADWPCAAYPDTPPSDVVLFGRLLAACEAGSIEDGEARLRAYRAERGAG